MKNLIVNSLNKDYPHKMTSNPFNVNVTKLRIKKLYILRHLPLLYLLSFQRKADNKHRSKFRTWPWPLTLTEFSRSKVKDLESKDPRSLSLPVLQLYQYKTYIKYERGNNSYKMSSDPFDLNVAKLCLELINNVQKVSIQYL